MSESGIEVLVHVPQVWLQPWREIPAHPARYQFIAHNEAMPIGVRLSTPPGLLGLKHTEQLECVGRAVLGVVAADEFVRPHDSLRIRRFHQWLWGEVLMESSGTTISVTSYEHGGTAVLAATWDLGEDFSAPLARLATARRIGKFPPAVARTLYERPGGTGQLPPPQVVVSNVIPVGIRRGFTALAAYSNRTSSTPIVMAVLVDEIVIMFDHRIYNPHDEQVFAEGFESRLCAEINARTNAG